MTDITSDERTRRETGTPVLAWMRLMRVYHKMDRRTADEMRPRNLSVSRFDVLNHAGAREGRTQQELADALFVTKGNICQLLDGMERDNLLYRRRRGRTNLIYLTDEGRVLREQALHKHEQRIADDMSALSSQEQRTLISLLRKLDKSLDERSVSKEGSR